MGLNSRLSAGILGLHVLSLVTIGGEAFATSTSLSPSASNTCCSTAHHNGFSLGMLLIDQRAPCNEKKTVYPSELCRFAKATATTDGDEAVHAISRAFLAEQEASGRVLTKRDQKWWARFQELEEYKQEHGDCNVPQRYKANPKLGLWVMHQRQIHKNNKLESERIEALEDIGFEWTRPGGFKPDDPAWWKRIADLKVYKEKHGDCNVPINYKANPQLAQWVYNQRACYHRFIDENRKQSPGITKERIEALNKIGFEWRLRERPEWDERYEELVAYKEKHGDTLVPMDLRTDSDNKYPGLAMWVNTQRVQYQLLQKGKHSYLTDERIQKLDKIGFVRDAQEAAWEEKFNKLIEFKATHGHTDVPSSWEDQELFRWVSVQRQEYRKLKEGTPSQMTEDRIQRLDGIGFEWRSKKTYQWKIRFGELRDFYDENGVVPVSHVKHPTLYIWVQRQKNEYDKFVRKEKTNMDEERIKDLESIGFFEVYGK